MTVSRLFRIVYLVASAGSLAGCAHSSLSPVRVRASESAPWPPLREGQPLIIDYKAGERIPVSIQVDGEVVETTPNPSTVWLTAKRDFSVRIQGAEIKTSLDGVHFDQKPAAPGRFQFGLKYTREGGVLIEARITTPVHAKP